MGLNLRAYRRGPAAPDRTTGPICESAPGAAPMATVTVGGTPITIERVRGFTVQAVPP